MNFSALRNSRIGYPTDDMSDLFGLNDERMAKPAPVLPKSLGKQRVDDRRMPSGIILIKSHAGFWGMRADQAARFLAALLVTPSVKVTPSIIKGNWLTPLRRRQVPAAP